MGSTAWFAAVIEIEAERDSEPTGVTIMASGGHGAALRQIHRVFDGGTLAGLSEGQLLERFATRLDEAAFEAILARYGPMVLGVCRRFLRHSHDIEDAFQATFLILVRRASSLRDRDLLGHWLYGVAYRVAVRARAQAALRRVREGSAVEDIAVVADPARVSDWHELNPLLDAEINRLPERYRAPIVLCLIEDRTHEEAARALGWPVGTVKSRLARGRERLRSRLARLGLAPSAALLSFAVAPDPVRAAVPPALAHATLQAARGIAAGRALLGAGSAVTLARGVLRSLALARLGGAALALFAVAVAVMAVAGMNRVTPGSEQTGDRSQVIAAAPGGQSQPPRSEARTLDLRVVDRKTRQPVVGAIVFLDRSRTPRHVTDAQGRCTIALPKDIPPRQESIISVWNDGFAPLSIRCTHYDLIDETFTNYTAELDPAEVMGGTVQDEQGHPIAGAKVRIWLNQTSAQPRNLRESVNIGVSDPITTDASGRWRLAMLPLTFTADDRLSFQLSHLDYVSDVHEPGRPNPALKDLRTESAILVMAKGVPVRGSVVDPAGNPVEGAPVSLAWRPTNPDVRYTTRTDAAGRFAFEHARAGEQAVCVQADRLAPYIADIVARPDMKPMTIRLQPARVIQGRVVDRRDQPFEGVTIRVAEWRNSGLLDWNTRTDLQGHFRWEGAPSDKITLVAHWQGVGSMSIPVAADANPAEVVVVTKAWRLRGTVVDAATGRPVPRIRVIRGSTGTSTNAVDPRFPNGRERPQWWYEDAQTFDGGQFVFDVQQYDHPRPPAPFVRVEAEGYTPLISRAPWNNQENLTWDVRLEPGPSVSGVVRLPGGPQVNGANVILVTPSEDATVRNGRLDLEHTHADRRRTGPDGKFWFARPDEPFLVAVLSHSGFAIRTAKEMAASQDILLQPWGRIAGILRIGRMPGAGEEVVADGPYARYGVMPLSFPYETTTDDQGRFVLDRVIPGGLILGRRVRTLNGMTYNSHLAYLESTPRGTASLTVGATGRPLVGRLILPPNTGPLIGFTSGWALMNLERPSPHPKDFLTWGSPRIMAWLGEFYQTEAGRAYFRQGRTYAAGIAPDGTFRIENVEPGSYELKLAAPHIQIGEQGKTWGRLSGNARREVVVPEALDGRSDDPIDLGRIEVSLINPPKLEVGDVASPFGLKTLDGKPLRLFAYRGKYVLLDFWTTWSGPCVAEIPYLKAVHEAFGSDSRFVMIGLSLDVDAEVPRNYAAAKGLKWVQGHLPTDTLVADYGVGSIPQILLISPDGKVIAKNLGGDRIKQAVAKALERHPGEARGR
jgi:RNA polymerase sigma factor (sigma-70 family)